MVAACCVSEHASQGCSGIEQAAARAVAFQTFNSAGGFGMGIAFFCGLIFLLRLSRMTIDAHGNRLTHFTQTSQPSFCAQTYVAYDADEQARNLHGWNQTYDQLTAGCFVGGLTELCVDHMQVFVETTSHTLRQTCEVQKDAYWFGIPTCPLGTGRIDAQTISADALAFRPGGVEFELLTSAGYEIFGVVVTGEALRRYAADVEGVSLDDRLPNAEVVSIGAERKKQLCGLLRQLLGGGVAGTAPLTSTARDNLQALVLASLFDVGALSTDMQAVMPARPRRQSIVWEARDYVLANRERAINVPELCERLHVSRRTLQYCFQDVLNMAPATYLRAIRLNGARRDLSNAARESRSVQEVAAAWGFWHLSQFATDYRKMFGIRPSEALKAAAGRQAGGLAH
jgi:AraC family ethanolamine operon transcriptional activator